jgi:hypothetical protein
MTRRIKYKQYPAGYWAIAITSLVIDSPICVPG